MAAARQDLAASQSALAEYEAQMAAKARAAKAAAEAASRVNQQLAGDGQWGTAVASHYSWNFTGKGASGEAIGPYTMMVAHKTLPFGTLIEFEYNGKRAVAKVADRVHSWIFEQNREQNGSHKQEHEGSSHEDF